MKYSVFLHVVFLQQYACTSAEAEPIGQIAAGDFHACAITKARGVQCWGAGYGSTPVEITGLASNIVQLAAGSDHTCALTDAGGVQCWGKNYFGALGNNSTEDSEAAADVVDMARGVTSIVAGYGNTCAVTDRGRVKCWGRDLSDVERRSENDGQRVPVEVAGFDAPVTQLVTAFSHHCVLTALGSVMCWGSDNFGDRWPYGSKVPVVLSDLPEGNLSLAAGHLNTCAITESGKGICWGSLMGHHDYRKTVVASLKRAKVAQISVGIDHICALERAGDVLCWGDNKHDQLGAQEPFNSVNRAVVPIGNGGFRVAEIQAGGNFTCARSDSGDIRCWGNHRNGELGHPSTGATSAEPLDVTGF